MKTISTLLLALITSASAAVSAQNLPDNPAQTPPPDPAWMRLESLAYGTPIVITTTIGPPVHCFLTSATAEYLDCHPAEQPAGVGYRFDRASVLSVDSEQWSRNSAQPNQRERNFHPAWISSIIAGGVIVGLCATPTTDAGHAAAAGAIGALVTAAIGAPLAFMPRDSQPYGPPPYGVDVPLRLGTRSRGLFRLHALH